MGNRNKRNSSHKIRKNPKNKNKRSIRTTIPSRGLSNFSAMRKFSLFPKQFEQEKESWLSKMYRYGATAMRIAVALLTSDELTASWMVSGTVQAVALGPEDLVYSSPICEQRDIELTYHASSGRVSATQASSVDYRRGRINHLVIKASCGSELSKRAGRCVVGIYSPTLDEAHAICKNPKSLQVPTFEELLLMPGATIAPYGVPIIKRWTPGVHDAAKLMCDVGQSERPTASGGLNGGIPSVVICVGYQDFASSSATAANLYAPEEAMIDVDISGSLTLGSWGTSWIRAIPPSGDAGAVQCEVRGYKFLHPARSFDVVEGILTTPISDLPETARFCLTLPENAVVKPLSIKVSADEHSEELSLDKMAF